MKDSRIRQIMKNLGAEHSQSLKSAIDQIINEVSQEIMKRETNISKIASGISRDEVGMYFYNCPECKTSHIRWNFKYCPICGSKLEWVDFK